MINLEQFIPLIFKIPDKYLESKWFLKTAGSLFKSRRAVRIGLHNGIPNFILFSGLQNRFPKD